MKKKTIVLIVVLVAIAVLVGSFWFYNSWKIQFNKNRIVLVDNCSPNVKLLNDTNICVDLALKDFGRLNKSLTINDIKCDYTPDKITQRDGASVSPLSAGQTLYCKECSCRLK